LPNPYELPVIKLAKTVTAQPQSHLIQSRHLLS
jgi:hypothetical protein